MDIHTLFQTTARELVLVQRELGQLYRLAADPLSEIQTAGRRTEILARRDHLLEHLSRLSLEWMLRGGELALVSPHQAEAHPPVEPAPTPPPVTETVEPSEPDEPRASAPPPTQEPIDRTAVGDPRPDLSALDRGIVPSWSRAVAPRVVPLDPEKLREILRQLGEPPEEIDNATGVQDELRRLAEFTSPAFLNAWVDMPKDSQRALVGMCVARARHVQDEIKAELHPATIEAELDRFFSGMTAFSKREQPGFVFGLRRHHHPVAESWYSDAKRWWAELQSRLPEPLVLNPERALEDLRRVIDEDGTEERIAGAAIVALDAGVAPEDSRLVRLMIPHQDKLRKLTRFKRLRKAIRDALSEDEAIEAEIVADQAAIPNDWPWIPVTRNHRAVIVGGDLREDARRRIQDTFGFSGVDWVTTDHSKNITNLATAIRGGTFDLVIILRRFIGHNVDRTVIPACRASDVPWVSVERGYGTSQLRIAIERFINLDEDDDSSEE